ncbi:MAG: helix-turn-helix transcriptional regulator [Clostridiales bacterium]|nr:helix-turn-helix transcriptional regulator [Clostridiales bacterium]
MIKNNSGCDCECIHREVTEKAMMLVSNFNELDNMLDFFKCVADETRLKIIYVLDKSKKMCVNDIAYSLNMTKSAVSHQLKNLKDNGLVKLEKIGKTVFYFLADKHVKDIFEIGLKHVGELV